MAKNIFKSGIAIAFFCLLTVSAYAQPASDKNVAIVNTKRSGAFPLVASKHAAPISFDSSEAEVVHIAARCLTADVNLLTGVTPSIDSTNDLKPHTIIIGTIGKSKWVDGLIRNKKLNVANIRDKWETFSIAVIDNPFPKVQQALVITGSDPRGTAFGVFELSRRIGVSPFYWWADIVPKRQQNIFVTKGTTIVGPPSVKYRGIFINDEDWGLQPWAAKTFEPEIGDIGPKTYAKVFELLLRLKANLIWPAMHPSTKAFYHYPGNKEVAADYSIIIGSSHAEPMLRNNVGEWDEKSMGHFNYITNKATVYKYWEDRVKESSSNNAMYTIGMRGVHDSGIEGVKTAKEAVPLLERIFEDQRGMLQQYLNKDITSIPQAFTAYKEVLEIYDNNLKLPEDVTLVWPDDNYGYIQRLNNEKEKKRAGGSGVYYHASYWGRPHDYLWLSSTHPALIRSEMMKAYEMKADRLWVLNVGDIKPLEYNIQLFLDMAYRAEAFNDNRYTKTHLKNWAGEIFGQNKAQAISDMLWQYYQLAFERRPEFMGWSQTEPTTETRYTEYNHFDYGDEAQQRISKYEAIEKQVRQLRKQIRRENEAAFYQLVYYPVVCASWMNKKFLYRDKSYLYAKQNRLSAVDYGQLSRNCYDSIVNETNYYNNVLARGKWKHMMSMKPRDLPVYRPPVIPEINVDKSATWSIAPEGVSVVDSIATNLPAFDFARDQKYFIDIFLTDNKVIDWTASTSANWIKLSERSGTLNAVRGKKETRLWVSIDWSKVNTNNVSKGHITFKGRDKQALVYLVVNPKPQELKSYKGFMEQNGYVSINASSYSRQTNNNIQKWKTIDGLGHTGKVMQALPLASAPVTTNEQPAKTSPCLEYDFYVTTAGIAEVTISTLPTHPLTSDHGMRYMVAVDDAPTKLVDFKTVGRSEEWKQNVLRNRAIKKVELPALSKGKHVLKIFMVDPGVTLEKILINLGGLKKAYADIPETRINR